MQETLFNFWVRKIPSRRDRLPTPVFLGSSGGSDSKKSACRVGDLDLIPGLGRSPGGGHGNSLQYCCLEIFHGQRSLVGCSPWHPKESDVTEWLSTCSVGNSPSSLTVWSIASLLSWYLPKTLISPHSLFHLGLVCKNYKLINCPGLP